MPPTSKPKASPLNCYINWMQRKDMPEVLRIERESFGFPWEERDFIACFQQRNVIGMVAEADGKTFGYMLYALAQHEFHLLNLAVAPSARRRCVGIQLIQRLKSKLSQQRRRNIIAVVRETSVPAQLFFRDLGSKATSVVRGHYAETDEDAYVFRYSVVAESPVENRLAVYFQGGA